MTKEQKKIKVMIISDHYSASSGVANQTRYVVNAQHKSGKFSFIYLGGGIRHADNNPIKYQEFGDDLIQYPVEGYGNPDIVRTIMKKHKPDILWYMSDPRFYEWLHAMENEIRVNMAMVWYTIWDNYPAPKYNRKFYECNDLLVPISKVTDNILKEVAPNTPRVRIPHTVDHDIFKKKWAENKITGQPVPIKEALMPENKDKFMVFFNSRNARRKLSGTLIFWFKEFLDRVGHENAFLLMHTDPKDPNGQDLDVILRDLELKNRQVLFSTEILNSNQLADLYNAADVTACISHSEGWGLCLDPNSIVSLKGEYKKLKDIEVGDRVLSFDGKYHEVQATSSRIAKTKEITVRGCGKIKSSYEHPFLVKVKDEYEWLRADELKKKDMLVFPKPKWNEELPEYIDLTEWVDCKHDDEYLWYDMGFSGNTDGMSITDIQKKYNTTKHYAESAKRMALGLKPKSKSAKVTKLSKKLKTEKLNYKRNVVNRFIKVDYDFLNLVGWYLAEGSNSSGAGIELDFHIKEKPIAKRQGKIVKNKFGVDKINYIERGNCVRMIFSSSIISEFFGKFCGIHSHNKNIHESILYSPKNLMPLIKGLYNGDGHHAKNQSVQTTTSPKMAYQVRDVLAANGIFGVVSSRIKCEDCLLSYSVVVCGPSHSKFCEWANELDENTSTRRRAEFIKQDENYFYVPVMNIEDSEEMTLMDIQVKDSHNFVANGVVVHNSSLESQACETPVISTKTGGLQEQITDGKKVFGVALNPVSKPIVGSQQVPYIYEDLVCKEDFVNGLMKLYKLWKKDPVKYAKIGENGRKHVLKNMNKEDFDRKWVEVMLDLHERCGSWETRKGYVPWEMKKL